MKILIFIESYYCSGVDTFVINLINNWPNQSDNIILICNRDHSGLGGIREKIYRPCTIAENKMIIFTSFFSRLKKKTLFDYFILFILKISSPLMRYIFLIYNVIALKKLLLPYNADRLLIVNGGYPGGDSCRAASICWGLFSKKPLSVHNFHGVVVRPHWYVAIQEYLVDVFISHFTKTFVTVSHAAASLMTRRKAIFKKHHITCIYNGVEILDKDQKINNLNIKNEVCLPQESKLCLMLGNYNYNKNFNKGHYFLFQAFKKVINQIPLAHLLICGHGSSRDIERIRRLVLKFKIEKNVHLLNFRNDIPSLLRHIDVLLVSAQVFESFGFASVEAMAHRVPVVATRVGAIPEIVINGEGGYCIPLDNNDSYAKRIIELLSNDVLRKEQGENGFQRYRDFFTASRMAKEYMQLINHE